MSCKLVESGTLKRRTIADLAQMVFSPPRWGYWIGERNVAAARHIVTLIINT